MPARLFHAEDDWYEWQPESSFGGASVFVRVAPRDDGRLGVTELRVVGTLSSELLRAIPVGRIEAAANAQLADFAMAESPAAVHRSPSRAPARHIEGGWDLVDTEPHARPRSARIPTRLAATDSRGRGDEFYAAVAGIYRELAQTSPRPAVAIAEANNAPVTTAHRWIKEARRRGFLGPGHPGKAG